MRAERHWRDRTYLQPMKKIILGVTPNRHGERAKKIQASLDLGPMLWFPLILAAAVAGWILHVGGMVPLIPHPTPSVPSYVTGAIVRVESPAAGGTAFFVGPTKLLSSMDALAGAGETIKKGDTVEVSIPAPEGGSGSSVKGEVSWISDEIDGVRLVLADLEKEQIDYLELSSESILNGQNIACFGYAMDSESGEEEKGGFFLRANEEGGYATLDWGDTAPPFYEGFPVLSVEDWRVKGVLVGGTVVIPLPLADLEAQGVIPPP